MSRITEPPKTLCKNCKWYRDRSNAGVDVWFNHICLAPAVQEPVTYSVVTGKPQESEEVYCTRINDGNCPHFVKRGPFRK
jgi:hypothetical protein